jgi:dTDP-4-amino-4,6-dideoxygalactose transaminase
VNPARQAAPLKSRITDLALFGGAPAFAAPLHVGRPNVGSRERFLERVNTILDRRWFTNDGPMVQEFERGIAARAGVKHAVAMCNATIALEIASRAVGFKGEVIVPSFTFVATAHALQWQEITPVFCDVDPATHNIDPAQIERLITPRTTGILPVHVWGRPCAIETIAAIAARHRLRVICDASHAFGCTHHGRAIGGFGDAEVFSFHATKFLNSFEGGAVVTNDDELAAKMRLMRNFGFAGYDRVIYPGTNGKMTEIAAAMGLTSLENIEEFIATNRRHYHLYRDAVADLPGVKIAEFDEHEKNNYQYIVLEIDPQLAGLTRDQLVQLLHAENVLARRYFYPGCHRLEPYASFFPNAHLLLGATEQLTQRVVSLPNGTGVTEDDVLGICALLRFACEHAAQISQRLGAVPASRA